MPYVTKTQREALTVRWPADAGELNYVITQQLLLYWRHPSYSFGSRMQWFFDCLLNYLSSHDRRYQTINDIVGAVECAKLEFIRRQGAQVASSFFTPLDDAKRIFYKEVAAPYEDEKITENGDVY